MTTVALMGSTGSIGRQTLEVVGSDPGRFLVTCLVARRASSELLTQVNSLRPASVGVIDTAGIDEFRAGLDRGVEVVVGSDAYALAAQAEVVVNGVSGFAGLAVTETALRAGRRLALANKESLIAAGDLALEWLATPGAELVPVDSEHSAIFQCLSGTRSIDNSVSRLVLTASGGPFRTHTPDELDRVSPSDALQHPTWAMGAKVTIDSSTLFNKGLEVIEAHYLFGISYDRIEVVVHPESIVHSMVSFRDGTTLAQLSQPDMRLPISLALYHPGRAPVSFGALDWQSCLSLHFEPVDHERFPGLGLAIDAGKRAGGAPSWFNAANEVAVSLFLSGVISWKQIYDVVVRSMDGYEDQILESTDQVVAIDAKARRYAESVVGMVVIGKS
ncbi:MAG: 1-deoxy-D-xylulose-5-phosphate reductoisomerase [Ferrimicrobium sp.]